MERLFYLDEVSKLLGVSTRHLRDCIKRGTLQARKIGKSYRILESELCRFVAPEGGRQ
jgi:excisionase family DNA binding protein